MRNRRVRALLRYLSVASLLTATASARAQTVDHRIATRITGEPFERLLSRVAAQHDSLTKRQEIESYISRVQEAGQPPVEDSTVHLLYYGPARRVSVPSDLNGWNATGDTMTRVGRTQLFHLSKRLDPRARFEYKLVVDSVWMLDPLNRREAIGGFGANSEIWMPKYTPPEEIVFRPDIPHGRIDTMYLASRLLRRAHPLFVYLPPGYDTTRRPYPTLYVTDGGEYLTLALMNNVLDNMIADRRIRPVVAVFVDPRTDPNNSATSMRMIDYSMRDTFVLFMVEEASAAIMKHYRVQNSPESTAIMGASLGGLIATYAAYTRPDVFGLCAAQSPAYWWRDGRMINMISEGRKRAIKVYIDTGTIRDAREHAHRMKEIMKRKGYEVRYAEYPEGHNWVNWRARIAHILQYFYGIKK